MTETVSKTKGASEPTATAVETKRKTLTNWRVFAEAGFLPTRFRCDGYLNSHPADLSCHSNMIPTVANVVSHIQPEHGGGWFRVKFRITDGKEFPLWRDLEEAGVEIQHLYCPHCREAVPVSPRAMMRHLQPHAGANRVNLDPQTLCMTLSFNRADSDEMEGLYEDNQ